MELKQPAVGFVFAPEGCHYLGMGKDLYTAFPSFASVIDALDDNFKEERGDSLKRLIWEDETQLDSPSVCDGGIFGMEVGLAALLREFGVSPSVVGSHSFGEYAAAVDAGVLSLTDGLRLVLGRAQLLEGKGKERRLIEIQATLERVNLLQNEYRGVGREKVPEIAGINAPDSIVVGGSLESVSEFEVFLLEKGIDFNRLSGSAPYAYQTSHMDPSLEDLSRVAAMVDHKEPTTHYVSSSSGKELSLQDFNPEYWVGLSRNTFHFSQAIQNVLNFASIIIEIGPNPTLAKLINRNFPENPPRVMSIISKDRGNLTSLLDCLSQLSLLGVPINWTPWFQRGRIPSGHGISPNEHRFSIQAVGNSFQELEFARLDEKDVLEAFEVEVRVIACSLNYKDKILVLQNSERASIPLGFDFSGIVSKVGDEVSRVRAGDQVYGILTKGGALASYIVIPESRIAKIPVHLSFEEASTIPFTYWIGWKALKGIGPKDRVLVNYGRGWIGIALTEIALHYGAEIFALSGSKERKEYLKRLGAHHIYDLEPGSEFISSILKDTENHGLSVVVNNFEEDFLKEAISLRLCSTSGKFVDVSRWNQPTEEKLRSLRPDVEFVELVTDESDLDMIFQEIESGVVNGTCIPFPFVIFPVEATGQVLTWFTEGKLGMAKPVILFPHPKNTKLASQNHL